MNLTKPAHRTGFTTKDIGGETIPYSANEKAIHVLTPPAQLIWELCDGGHTVAAMEQAIRANFSVPAEHDVMTDIQQTLALFADKDLLQRPV